jgi:hypothetical protein
MNPESRLLLEEIDKHFAAQEKRFNNIEHKMDSTTAASSTRLDALESAAKVFNEWRPGIEGVVDDLKIEVNNLATLKLEVGKLMKYWERSMVDVPSATPGVFAAVPGSKSMSAPSSPSAAAVLDNKPVIFPNSKSAINGDFQAIGRASTGYTAEPPSGHRVDQGNQAGEFRVVTTLIPPPGKGTLPCRPASPLPLPKPPPRHPPPLPGHHRESRHQGAAGAATLANCPSLISLNLMGITLSCGLNKLFITLICIELSPLFGSKQPLCTFRVPLSIGFPLLKIN